MTNIRMRITEIGKGKLLALIFIYIVLGMLAGLFNAWGIGQFPSIRSDAEQKLSELEKTESATLFDRAKKIAKRWALKEQLNSTSPLAFAGAATFCFLIPHVVIARFLLRKKYKECKYSYPISGMLILIFLSSVLLFSALFHSNMYSIGNDSVSVLSALAFYSSMWLAWLFTSVIIFFSISTNFID